MNKLNNVISHLLNTPNLSIVANIADDSSNDIYIYAPNRLETFEYMRANITPDTFDMPELTLYYDDIL
jgi:hypothetical protein